MSLQLAPGSRTMGPDGADERQVLSLPRHPFTPRAVPGRNHLADQISAHNGLGLKLSLEVRFHLRNLTGATTYLFRFGRH